MAVLQAMIRIAKDYKRGYFYFFLKLYQKNNDNIKNKTPRLRD